MSDWDDDDFDIDDEFGTVSSKPDPKQWEGEDDGFEATVVEAKEATAPAKKKKGIKKAIADRKEKDEKDVFVDEEEEEVDENTQKERRKKEIIKSDFENLEDMFGDMGGVEGIEKGSGLDEFNPTTEAEFTLLASYLSDKVIKFEKSPHYVDFLKRLVRQCTVNKSGEVDKQLASACNAVANEKIKAAGGKKKTTKAATKKKGLYKKDFSGGDRFDEFADFM